MASPQLENGYIRIANELIAALMQSDFSKRQRNILDLIIRMSYGCGKKSALLRYSDFELVGVWKVDIKKELTYLAATKVIIVEEQDSLLRMELNKNYDQWRVSLVKTMNFEKWEQVLKRNLGDRVSESLTHESNEVSKTLTHESIEVSKTLTNPENGISEILTNTDNPVSILLTERDKTVSKILTDTPVKPNDGACSEPRKDIDLKDIKDKDNKSSSSMPPLSPQKAAPVTALDEYSLKLQELDDLRSQITGKTFPNGHETQNEHQILRLAGGDMQRIRSVIQSSLNNFRKNNPGEKGPKTLGYFVPLFQQLADADKARAAPPPVDDTQCEEPEPIDEAENKRLADEILNLLPEHLRKEAIS